MSFETTGYVVIRNAVQKDVVGFLVDYMSMKEQVARTLYDSGYLENHRHEWGGWDDPQSHGAYSNYSDIAMESVLVRMHPVMEKFTGFNLVPNYSYTRTYINGNTLLKHTDREECEVSATLSLGGDEWPIYIGEGLEVNLKPGDALAYLGAKIPHWRNKFRGDKCYQAFFHYNRVNKDGSTLALPFDGRPHLGLPPEFKVNRRGDE